MNNFSALFDVIGELAALIVILFLASILIQLIWAWSRTVASWINLKHHYLLVWLKVRS